MNINSKLSRISAISSILLLLSVIYNLFYPMGSLVDLVELYYVVYAVIATIGALGFLMLVFSLGAAFSLISKEEISNNSLFSKIKLLKMSLSGKYRLMSELFAFIGFTVGLLLYSQLSQTYLGVIMITEYVLFRIFMYQADSLIDKYDVVSEKFNESGKENA